MDVSGLQGVGASYQNMFNNDRNDESLSNSQKLNEQEKLSPQKKVELEIKEQTKEVSKDDKKAELQDLTEKLNKEMQPMNTSIKFGFDEDVKEMYVNVIDKATDKVIRKIPSDEALELMAKMREVVGALFDEKG